LPTDLPSIINSWSKTVIAKGEPFARATQGKESYAELLAMTI
jgi:hypothetical protein